MKKNNHPHLTAIARTDISLPTRKLLKFGLLKGRILDFGCGRGVDTEMLTKSGYDITGYDNYYRKEYPQGKFDTIICQYVLNVLEESDQAKVIEEISRLLKPDGVAYFAVRRDLVKEGFRLHAIYKMWTYQVNVILPYDSVYRCSTFEIYRYKLSAKEHESSDIVGEVLYERLEGELVEGFDERFGEVLAEGLDEIDIVEEQCDLCNLGEGVEVLYESDFSIVGKLVIGDKVATIVFPKNHVSSINELSGQQQDDLFYAIKKIYPYVDYRSLMRLDYLTDILSSNNSSEHFYIRLS